MRWNCFPSHRFSRTGTIAAGTLALAMLLPMQASGEPGGGPAEYAFRWNAGTGNGPTSIDAAAALLEVSKKDSTTYLIQYREANRPKHLPMAVRLIARQRTEHAPDAGKVESTYKFRASEPLEGLAPAAQFPCLLKGADWEGEVDVSWSLKLAAASAPTPAQPAASAPVVVTEVHSRTCSAKAPLEDTLPAQTLLDKPNANCTVKMVRFKDDDKKLKVEEWRMPGGEVLLEASRKVKKDTAKARADFEKDVVRHLLKAGSVPSKENKTELAKCT
jgi:hypothetical protein